MWRMQSKLAILIMRQHSHNYSVISNRYQNGLALVTDMVDAANQRLDAQLALVNSRIKVLFNYYNLKYITGTL